MTRSARFWPIAIVVLLAANVAGTVVMMRAAGGENAGVVEPDYYRRAVAWDSIATAQDRARALGWTLHAELGAIGDDGAADVELRLRDRAGSPVQGGSLRVLAIHNAHAAHPVTASMPQAATGRFAARLPLRWAGRWELRCELEHQGERVPLSVRAETAAR